MSTALINKYRPTTFEQVLGQEHVVASLRNIIAKKLATAFLFVGPSGTGKTTLSRIVARELGADPRSIVEIDAASNTGIEAMREVMADAMYAPLAGTVKVIIVDEAQLLSKQAIQSLLKLLEEPPAHLVWMLCTTDPSKFPEAILTRTTRLDLKLLSIKDLGNLANDIADAEQMTMSDAVYRLVIKAAEGSPRRLLSILAKLGEVTDEGEAKSLLASGVGEDSVEAFEIARLLMGSWDWADAMVLVGKLGDVTPETVRRVVLAYYTKVAIGSTGNKAVSACAVLDAFTRPYDPTTGLAPLLLSLAKLAFGD